MPRKTAKRKNEPALPTYYELSQKPLQALLFLAPLIILYEVATAIAVRSGDHDDIIARSILKVAFETVGVTGVYLPGIIVAVLLLSMHIVSKDRWEWMPKMYGVMWLESLTLALPILLFVTVFLRHADMTVVLQAGGEGRTFGRQLVLMVGAGIYEELVFRLLGIAIIHALVVDLLALPKHVGELVAIGVTAVLFTLYHRTPDNPLTVRKLVFYLLAGIYFACIYVYRGFGIVAGTHAVYDVMVASLGQLQGD